MTGYLPREQKLPGLQKISVRLDLLKILLRLAQETNRKFMLLIFVENRTLKFFSGKRFGVLKAILSES